MARQPLSTQLAIDRVTPRRAGGRDSRRVGGTPGLVLRISPDGTKSYSLRYRLPDGRQPRVTLGQHPLMSLAQARAAALALLDQVARGIDPAAERALREKSTVRAVAVEYVERHARQLRSRRWIEQMLERDVVRVWGDRPVESIARADVVRLVDRVADRGSPVSANRVLALVRALFGWALDRGLVQSNPALGVRRPHKEAPRERTLDDDELRRVWAALEAMGPPYGAIGMLLLLTGLRRSEVACARWSEVDLAAAVLHVPGERMKGSRPHDAPLPPAAVELLRGLPRLVGCDFVFPGRSGDRAVACFAHALKRAQTLSETGGWVWHDCRRTVRSGLGRLGVRPDVAERVLAHVVGTVVQRTYDTYRYQGEVRRAVELWAGELERITSGGEGKVVALRSARA